MLSEARREYQRAWYKENPTKRKEYRENYRKRHPKKWRYLLWQFTFYGAIMHHSKIQFCRYLKSITRCKDCRRYDKPYLMDFDHVRGKKTGKVASMGAWPSLLRELSKCDIVCVRCHRKRTWQRQQFSHPKYA